MRSVRLPNEPPRRSPSANAQPRLPNRRAVITMKTTTEQAITVRIHVDPVRMEKAAPGLRVRLSCSRVPSSSRG
jgi:hypothetical protein